MRRVINAIAATLSPASPPPRDTKTPSAWSWSWWRCLRRSPCGSAARGVERALLIGCLILVLIVELLNSAIEATVDRISFENHRLAKRAKDIGSAAVMLSLVNAGIVWLFIILS